MNEIALLFAYGLITILVLVGYSWLMRDLKIIIKKLEDLRFKQRVDQSAIWSKSPKKAKLYTTWSRKGTCPSCSVETGSKHREGCQTREALIRSLENVR